MISDPAFAVVGASCFQSGCDNFVSCVLINLICDCPKYAVIAHRPCIAGCGCSVGLPRPRRSSSSDDLSIMNTIPINY